MELCDSCEYITTLNKLQGVEGSFSKFLQKKTAAPQDSRKNKLVFTCDGARVRATLRSPSR